MQHPSATAHGGMTICEYQLDKRAASFMALRPMSFVEERSASCHADVESPIWAAAKPSRSTTA
jgi:hypothetical protein